MKKTCFNCNFAEVEKEWGNIISCKLASKDESRKMIALGENGFCQYFAHKCSMGMK